MKQSIFLSRLITEELVGSKYARLVEPFRYYSRILDTVVEVPTGFVCDYESVFILKATSKRSGVLHDFLCRCDSIPIVTKQVAASVYNESQALRDNMVCKNKFHRGWRLVLRFVKTSVVRIAPFYFHKFKVMATAKELKNKSLGPRH